MAILDLKKKIEPYLKTATGYVKQMLSSKHVVMEDGNDLETTVTELNRNTLNITKTENIEKGGISYYYSIITFNNKKYLKLYGRYQIKNLSGSTLTPFQYGTISNLTLVPEDTNSRILNLYDCSIRCINSGSGLFFIGTTKETINNNYLSTNIQYLLTNPPISPIFKWIVVCEIE